MGKFKFYELTAFNLNTGVDGKPLKLAKGLQINLKKIAKRRIALYIRTKLKKVGGGIRKMCIILFLKVSLVICYLDGGPHSNNTLDGCGDGLVGWTCPRDTAAELEFGLNLKQKRLPLHF